MVNLDAIRGRQGRRGAGAVGAAAFGFLLSTLVTGGAVVAQALLQPSAEVVQPIEFNHRVHVEDEGMECLTCHAHGMPPASLCTLCHAEAQGESAEEARLVAHLASGRPLEWASLFRQPHHVYFSHRLHVEVAQLECQVCHGDIGTSTAPPRRVKPLTMDDCVDCHAERGAPQDCTACHR